VAFADLHEEVAEMFSLLEGQTTRLGTHGGYHICHSEYRNERDSEFRNAYQRRWAARWRKNNPEKQAEVVREQGEKRKAALLAIGPQRPASESPKAVQARARRALRTPAEVQADLEKQREYRKANAEKASAYKRRYRARLASGRRYD
jgi:hypothetical protein